MQVRKQRMLVDKEGEDEVEVIEVKQAKFMESGLLNFEGPVSHFLCPASQHSSMCSVIIA
jgi:hypothetical protein